MNGYEIRARRRAREIVDDLRWRGMAVPTLYDRMAHEFQDLVRSGDYATWLTTAQRGAGLQAGGGAGHAPLRRPRATRAARGAQLASAGQAAVADLSGPLYA